MRRLHTQPPRVFRVRPGHAMGVAKTALLLAGALTVLAAGIVTAGVSVLMHGPFEDSY